jgi:glycosyltransferase involved in cell wall biosynthesis
MNKKKLLLINWRDIKNPEAGGAEIYYHELFRRLAGMEFDITVLSHNFPGAPHRETIDGINVIRHGGKWLFNYEIIPWLLREHRNYDLIIEDLNKIPFLTPLYLKCSRLHLVMHFFGKEIFREALFPAALYVYCMEKLVPVFYRKERFVAISESTAREIERFPVPRSHIGIVEPGIDCSYYYPTSPKADPPVIAFMGRLMKYKNAQFIIRMLPRLRSAVLGCTLEIGGTGEYLQALQHIATQCGVAEQVRFLGRISEEAKRDLLSRASLFVNPSAKEGWGINNIEANLCGTVSLSSNVPGLRDSVDDGKTGVLYAPDDADDFHEKAVRLLTEHTERSAMEKAARKRALEFDWDHMARKLTDYLRT